MAKILVVDDDADIRSFAKAVLASRGHQVDVADNAMTAFHYMRHNRIDVLITDANMPRVKGFDLLRMLKSEGGFDQVSVVMLTCRNEKEHVQTAVQLGVHDYVIKPVDAESLVQKIESLLERRPPLETEASEIAAVRISEQATAVSAIELVAISELGLVIRSPHAFHAGSPLRIEAPLIEELGLRSVALRIFVSEQRDGYFETRVSFLNLDDVNRARIQKWMSNQILTTASKTAKSA